MSSSLPTLDSESTPVRPPRDERRHLLNIHAADLKAWVVELGEKPFRAGQIWKWVYERRAESFAEMTDLPQRLRESLESRNFS